MNFKTAALGTMLTAGTVFGGCARKMPEGEKLLNTVKTELIQKKLADSVFNGKDSVLFKAAREAEYAKNGIEVAKAKYEKALADLVYKKDSISFANKKDCTVNDSIIMLLRDMQRSLSGTNVNFSKSKQDFESLTFLK